MYESPPHTLDAGRVIPEDAAPSAGVSQERAAEIKAANDEYANPPEPKAKRSKKDDD